MILLDLIHNITLIVTLMVLYQLTASHWRRDAFTFRMAAGVLFGAVGVVGMMTPMHFAPGIIYDGRSIILSVAGLFGGPITAAISAAMCATYRGWLGGAGAPAGLATIVFSALVGVAFYYWRLRDTRVLTMLPLWGFGLLVHVGMLAFQLFLLPEGVGRDVVRQFGVLILILYPAATVLICWVFLNLETHQNTVSALQESEAKYRTLVENIPMSVFIKDRNFRFISANENFENELNIRANEAIGKTDYDFFPKEYADKYRADDERILTQGVTEQIEETFFKDGQQRWMQVFKTPVRDDRGHITGLLGIFWDITERRSAQQKLRENERFLNDILSTIQDGVCVLNPDLTIRYANPVMEAWYADRMPLVGAKCHHCYHLSDRPCAPCPSLRCMESKQVEFDIVPGPSDSAIQWVEVYSYPMIDEETGEIMGVIEFVRDISQRKLAEDELLQSEALLRIAGELAHLGGWSANLIENRVIWSDEVAGIHEMPAGYSPTVEEGIRFYAPECRERIKQVYSACAREGVPYDEEMQIVTANGRRVWVRTIGIAERDPSGAIVRVLGGFQDITERKKAEEALRHSYDLMRYIIEHNRSAIAVHDRDLNYIFVSQRYLNDFRVKDQDIIGKHHYDVFPDLPQKWRDVHQRALAGEVLSAEDDPFYRDDGTVDWTRWECRPWYEASGAIGGIIIYTEVITERKRMEDALRQSEENYRKLFEEHAAVKLLVDPDTGNIINANEAAARFYGWPRERLKSMKISEINTLSAEEIQKGMERAKANQCIHFDFRHRLADGSIRDVSVFSSKITINGKELLHSIIHDVTEGKRAEEALRQSEYRYRSLLNDVSWVAVQGYSPEGEVRYWNKASETVYGYSAEEALGKNLLDLIIPPEMRDEVKQAVAHMVATGQSIPPAELQLMRKDGTRVSVFSHHAVIDIPGVGKEIFCIDIDLTQQKRSEEELRKAKTNLEIALDAGRLGDWYGDLITGELVWSKRCKAIFGLPPDAEVDFERFIELIHPDDRVRVQEEVNRAIENRGEYKSEKRIIWPDGSIHWNYSRGCVICDETGTPTLLAGVTIDITERKRAEEELRKLSRVIEQSSTSVTITDLSGAIEYVNPRFTEMTGYTLDEVRGKNSRILKSGETPMETYTELWERITSGRVWRGELHNKGKDGTLYWVRAVIAPVLDESGATTHYVAMKENITNEKTLEAQLLQAQKMESVGRLAGGVAHDFNNMLCVIIGYAQMAKDKLTPDDRLHFQISEILKAAQRSSDITQQLLAFARKQTVSPKIVDLNQLINDMLKMLGRLIGENIRLRWMPGASIWQVKIDPAQIDQILMNLVVNARDAIRDVGSITIETANAVIDESYCEKHAGFKPGFFVALTVSDDGCGIKKELLPHLFEPFYTTKGVGEGTGLGLATVYGIVKQNEGFINVYSELEKGSSFRIYIPRFLSDKASHTSKESVRTLQRGTETVLIVEDEDSILELAEAILEDMGYNVLTADSPEAAIRLVEGFNDTIHLLITDMIMPGMNGKQLADRLTALQPEMKRIYMSGYTANVIAHHGVLDEGIHFLQKPFSLKSLVDIVREALDG